MKTSTIVANETRKVTAVVANRSPVTQIPMENTAVVTKERMNPALPAISSRP